MSAPKLSNLDCTRRRAVKKGCVVQFVGGATVRVQRVRLGYFWTECSHFDTYYTCSRVKVLSE
jgi:hypothetical protein